QQRRTRNGASKS
nr:Chain C, Protein Vpr [HIV-1 M:B_89.6]5B56_D Chain D, Protein Vpr [HIV-1 M:B_89.6]5B56_E Chain E, Protein Vpr [HIV-1 M:B_89.6]5B56_F Chain F, Protein Vpr [HIV-1 M:B_89.6]